MRRPRWLRRRWHRHVMRNFSSGYDWRYCVAGLWDPEQQKMVRCPYTDNNAH